MDKPLLNIVLFEPEIPYNAGAVGRTCVALGAKLWLVQPLGFHVDDRQLKRAGLDYWQHLDWQVVADWQELARRLSLSPAGGRPWFFSKKAERLYTDARFEQGDVLVFGSESQGLPSRFVDAEPDRTLRIPVRPEVRSLNLSVAVGVAAFEAVRQWRQIG